MRYELDPPFRRVMFLCGIFFSICFLFGAAILLFDPAVKGTDAAVIVFTIIFGGVAWWCFRFRREPERYRVEISDYGISVGGHAFVPWTDIAAVRENRRRQRLELLDASVKKLAAFEYQLTDIGHLIEQVRERALAPRPATSERVFGKRRRLSAMLANIVMGLLLGGALVWLWIELHHRLVLVAAVVLAWSIYTNLRHDVREIELRERDLAIRTFLRERLVAAEEVAETALMLRPSGGNQQLSCAIRLRSGEAMWLAPPGVNPAELHEAIRHWLRRASAA